MRLVVPNKPQVRAQAVITGHPRKHGAQCTQQSATCVCRCTRGCILGGIPGCIYPTIPWVVYSLVSPYHTQSGVPLSCYPVVYPSHATQVVYMHLRLYPGGI